MLPMSSAHRSWPRTTIVRGLDAEIALTRPAEAPIFMYFGYRNKFRIPNMLTPRGNRCQAVSPFRISKYTRHHGKKISRRIAAGSDGRAREGPGSHTHVHAGETSPDTQRGGDGSAPT